MFVVCLPGLFFPNVPGGIKHTFKFVFLYGCGVPARAFFPFTVYR
jgi:hypothetical protein